MSQLHVVLIFGSILCGQKSLDVWNCEKWISKEQHLLYSIHGQNQAISNLPKTRYNITNHILILYRTNISDFIPIESTFSVK